MRNFYYCRLFLLLIKSVTGVRPCEISTIVDTFPLQHLQLMGVRPCEISTIVDKQGRIRIIFNGVRPCEISTIVDYRHH